MVRESETEAMLKNAYRKVIDDALKEDALKHVTELAAESPDMTSGQIIKAFKEALEGK